MEAINIGPKMNRTEARFAAYLDLRVKAGEIQSWWFEAITIRIGVKCFWKPDFLVQGIDNSLTLYDTKGTRSKKHGGGTAPLAKDDAVVKARAISDKFPIPVYFVWQERNGEWARKRM